MKKLIVAACSLFTLCAITFLSYQAGAQDMLPPTLPMDSDMPIALPRLALSYYFIIAFALTLIIGIAWFLSGSRRSKLAIFCRYAFFVPISYIAGQVLVKRGLNFLTLSLERDLTLILMAAVCIYLLIILGLSPKPQASKNNIK